ncbi:exported hypothetical protein [Verrucomicrobia bacterium]|nr:exported hypothetical protein [Verrucomicrobiota bacterium]
MCKNKFKFQGVILTNACAFGYVVAAGLAKRLECVQLAQLAAAFECQACPKAPASRRTPSASRVARSNPQHGPGVLQ